jgi:hypothetical protein
MSIFFDISKSFQACFFFPLSDAEVFSWKIHSIVTNVKSFSAIFSSGSFLWVKRDTNEVKHALAKFATIFPTCFSCNSSNLSPSISKAWLRDLLSSS